MKEQCKTDFFSIFQCKNNLGFLFVKNPCFQCRFISNHFVQHFFIIRKLFNKLKHQSSILPFSISEC